MDGRSEGTNNPCWCPFTGAYLAEANMSGLSDIQIKAWIKNDERFEQRGDGLFLSYRKDFAVPI